MRELRPNDMLPFSFKVCEFQGSDALGFLFDEIGRPHAYADDGDRYGMKPRASLAPTDVKRVYPAFNSLFQGDHLGVEYALSSHCNLLESAGLLHPDVMVQLQKVFPRGPL